MKVHSIAPRAPRVVPLSILALVAAVASAAPAASPQGIIADQSEVAYVADQMGVAVEGNFTRFSAHVELDPAKLQAGSVAFSVDTSSIDFPSADVLKELAKPDWFDTAHFPAADFRSSAIRAAGAPDRYQIDGVLTIKGHSHPVVVPVVLKHSGATTLASGSLTIKRLDYGVGTGEWSDTSLVSDEVQIKFKIAMRAPG
jgi:polyisoprenoid-binding protein YceI